MRRRPNGVFNNTRQMAAALATFVAVILLMESGGLAVWAERLEIGPGRTLAVRLTSKWHRIAAPWGVGRLRDKAIVGLQRVGWSDDAVVVTDTASPVTPKAVVIDKPVTSPHVAPNAVTPVVETVPLVTKLVPLPAPPEGRPRVVALAGDSMMVVGISSVLLREIAKRSDLQMLRTYRSGTGLARPEVFNWMDQYPAMLHEAKPDVVIVAIGANDGQGFVENGEVLPFGSDKWIAVYRQRVSNFLDLLQTGGARVLWLGLPPMKAETYNQKIAQINRIVYTEVMRHNDASWWNPTPFVGDESGRFREFLTSADNKTIRIRAADGIHLSDEGAALFVPVLLKWLDEKPSTATASSSPVRQ